MIMHEASLTLVFVFHVVTSFLMAHNGQPRRVFSPGFLFFWKLNRK